MASIVQPFNIFGSSFGTFLLFLVFFIAMYGIMMGTGLFGDNKGIQFIISFVVALIFVSSANAISFLFGSLRSVVIIFVVVFLVFLVHGFLGIKAEKLMASGAEGGLLGPKSVGSVIILIALLIIFISNWRPAVESGSGDGGAVIGGGGGTAPWSGARAAQVIGSTGFIAVLGFLLLFGFVVNSVVGKMGGG